MRNGHSGGARRAHSNGALLSTLDCVAKVGKVSANLAFADMNCIPESSHAYNLILVVLIFLGS
jgi:hypothetical protein